MRSSPPTPSYLIEVITKIHTTLSRATTIKIFYLVTRSLRPMGATTLRMTTLTLMILIVMGLWETLIITVSSVFMLRLVMLSVAFFIIMLSVFMLNSQFWELLCLKFHYTGVCREKGSLLSFVYKFGWMAWWCC
jgi:hypothetical protein